MALRYGPTAAAMSRESCSTSEMSRSAAVVDPDLSCVVRIAWRRSVYTIISHYSSSACVRCDRGCACWLHASEYDRDSLCAISRTYPFKSTIASATLLMPASSASGPAPPTPPAREDLAGLSWP